MLKSHEKIKADSQKKKLYTDEQLSGWQQTSHQKHAIQKTMQWLRTLYTQLWRARKTSSEKQKLREFITSGSALEDTLKEVI